MYKTILFISCLFLICSAIHVNLNHEAQFYAGKINIQADNGAYRARCFKCGAATIQNMVSIHETNPKKKETIWTVEKVGDLVAFKSD